MDFVTRCGCCVCVPGVLASEEEGHSRVNTAEGVVSAVKMPSNCNCLYLAVSHPRKAFPAGDTFNFNTILNA